MPVARVRPDFLGSKRFLTFAFFLLFVIQSKFFTQSLLAENTFSSQGAADVTIPSFGPDGKISWELEADEVVPAESSQYFVKQPNLKMITNDDASSFVIIFRFGCFTKYWEDSAGTTSSASNSHEILPSGPKLGIVTSAAPWEEKVFSAKRDWVKNLLWITNRRKKAKVRNLLLPRKSGRTRATGMNEKGFFIDSMEIIFRGKQTF